MEAIKGRVNTSLSPAEREKRTVPQVSHRYTLPKGIIGARPKIANPAIVKNGIDRMSGAVFIRPDIKDINRSTHSWVEKLIKTKKPSFV